MKAFHMLALTFFVLVASAESAVLQAQPTQQSLDATGQLIVNSIKDMCRLSHPDNDYEFRKCAESRYDAMKSFFAKLFHYRDTKGTQSSEFKKGLTCVENASPSIDDQGRKMVIERADWISANACYEEVLR